MNEITPKLPPELEETLARCYASPTPSAEFASHLESQLMRKMEQNRGRHALSERTSFVTLLRTRPLMAVLIALLILLALTGVAYAIGKSLGYIPGIGLVNNTSGIRMLAEPVVVTRAGVSLTISSVLVYADRVELVYEVKGIPPENDGALAADAVSTPTAFCGGAQIGSAPSTDGDARLQLSDGAVLERDRTTTYPQNAFAMKPVYVAAVPSNVRKMTLVLDCIPWARRGAVPEHWSVPFELKSVPAGTIVGQPVIEVQPTVARPMETPAIQPTVQKETSPAAAASTVPVRQVTMTLKRVVLLDSATVVFFSMDMENRDPSLVSIMPLKVYAIDSQGQRIQMLGNYVWQPFEHRVGSEFEFTTLSKPASGPLTIVVEKAVAYYAPGHVEPRQAPPAQLEFTFDAGDNPQVGQTWDVDHTIEIAGYHIRVISAQATTYDEFAAKHPDFNLISQGYLYGYDFALEADPSVKILVEMDIMAESPACWLSNSSSLEPESNSILYLKLCRDQYPKGNVKVQLWQLAVLQENTWQQVWNP